MPTPKRPLNVLVADDNGRCIAQARFTTDASVHPPRIHVLALIGATQYVDRWMPRMEAVAQYRELLDAGWVAPQRTPILSERQLRDAIHD